MLPLQLRLPLPQTLQLPLPQPLQLRCQCRHCVLQLRCRSQHITAAAAAATAAAASADTAAANTAELPLTLRCPALLQTALPALQLLNDDQWIFIPRLD